MTKYAKMAYFALIIVISWVSWIMIILLMGFSFITLLLGCILAGVLSIGDRARKIYTASVIFPLILLIWAVSWGLLYIYPTAAGIFVAKLYDWFGNHGDWFAVIVGIPLSIVALHILKMHEKSSRYFAISIAAFIVILSVTLLSNSPLGVDYVDVILLSVPYIVSALLAALVGGVSRPYQDIILWLIVFLVLILMVPIPIAET